MPRRGDAGLDHHIGLDASIEALPALCLSTAEVPAIGTASARFAKLKKFRKKSLTAIFQYILRMLFAKLEEKMALVGYARVSTQGQDLTAQIEALKAAGAETIYKEKVSGVRADRPQLAKLMARLMPGNSWS